METKKELMEWIEKRLEQVTQEENELAEYLDFVCRNEKTAFEMLDIENPLDQKYYYDSLLAQRRGMNWVINNLRNQLIILRGGEIND